MLKRNHRAAAALVFAAATAASAVPVLAADVTWNGNGSSNNFSDAGNWVNGIPPAASGDNLRFALAAGITPFLEQAYSANSVLFPELGIPIFGYTFGGATLTIGAGGMINANGLTRVQEFNNPLALSADQTWMDHHPTDPPNSATRGFVLNSTLNLGSHRLTLDYDSTVAIPFHGVIGGPGGITKTGPGSAYFKAANTYSGDTIINEGAIKLMVNNALPATSLVLSTASSRLDLGGFNQSLKGIDGGATINLGGGALTVGQGQSTNTHSGQIVGPGTFTKVGNGAQLLSNASNTQSATNINGGLLAIDRSGALGSGPVNFGGGGLWVIGDATVSQSTSLGSTATFLTSSSTLTYNGAISGSGALVKTGNGTLVLNAINSYTGGTQVRGGTLVVAHNAALGAIDAPATVLDGGTLKTAFTLFSRGLALGAGGGTIDLSNTTFIGGTFSGSGKLNKTGAGILRLSNLAHTWSGGLDVLGGRVEIDTDAQLGASPNVRLDGGGINFRQSIVSERVFTLGSNHGVIDVASGQLVQHRGQGAITGSGNLVKTGGGVLSLQESASTNYAYTGNIRILGGTLEANSDAALGGGSIEVNGGTLRAASSFIATKNLTLGANGATLASAANNHLQVTGTIGGAGPLAIGPGRVFITRGNSYTGGTIVRNNAELQAANTTGSATGPGLLRVQSGGWLTGTGAVGDTVIESGGTLAPTHSTDGAAPLDVVSLQMDPASTWRVLVRPIVGGGFQWSRVVADSAVTIDGTLEINLLGAFDPQIGQSFTILDAPDGFLTGTFATVSGRELSPTKWLATIYEPAHVRLAVALPGDATLDGFVNLADFNVLASNFGQSGLSWLGADFTGDGLVNLSDFNLLAANFGISAAPSGPAPEDWATLASAVPEPSASLCVGAMLMFLLPRRRRS